MSKRSREPQEDDIQVNGKPIRSLHVFDLKMELKRWGLSKKGKKQELVDRLSHHLSHHPGTPSPHHHMFDTLPDEIVLKIVKMATKTNNTHDKIINQISRVSSRFNRIAKDGSLWKGKVILVHRQFGHTMDFLSDGITELILANVLLHKQGITLMGRNCPSLISLQLVHTTIDSWPSHSISWGLKKLRIRQNISWNDNTFENINVKLDLIFPKLESLRFDTVKAFSATYRRSNIWLPNMADCRSLQEVHMEMIVKAGPLRHAVKFEIPADLEDTGPFPQGLEKLKLYGSIWNYPEEKIRENKGPHCKLILRGPVDGRLV